LFREGRELRLDLVDHAEARDAACGQGLDGTTPVHALGTWFGQPARALD
jgi:hypothetical protein